jgi:transposase
VRATAFNRIIAIERLLVEKVTFAPEGVVLRIRRRKKRHQCPCGWTTKAHYDRSTRRWHHLDLGAAECFLETEICRINCQRCGRGDRGRPLGSTRCSSHDRLQFGGGLAAQLTDKTTITTLLRVSWKSVAKIVVDVVADHLDVTRFDGLRRIGVDEVAYRKGHRYLTVVADHE